jgi:hypothetical protein
MLDGLRPRTGVLARCAIPAVLLLAALAPATASAAPTPPWDPFFATPQDAANIAVDARPYGIASGDFDEDGDVDLVVGRTTGNVYWVAGNGDGTFAAPAIFAWKQTTNNAWSMAAGDVNSDGNLDVVWGANTDSSGCTISGVGCTVTPQVLDGEVRAYLGNGDGTFQQNSYFVSGVLHNKGMLLADVGTDAGSVAAADADTDGDVDVVAGSIDATNATVKLLRNAGSGAMTVETVASSTAGASGTGSPIYFPISAATAVTSPFGLAFGDADADGDADLFVGDRALYVYRFDNNGAGAFTIHPGNIPQLGASRANVYLRHDPTYRAAVGFTPSLAAGDVNGDGKADVAVGLHSGTQTVASNTVHDGEIILDVSDGAEHKLFGSLGDVGTNARGLQLTDVNGDAARDIVAGELQGKVKLMRQLPPRDDDGDGISDYVDNAPAQANAPRIDMNTDGALTYLDQLDNDDDTVLGDPENESSWQRNGDAADADDDNDGISDAADNCKLVANAAQDNGDGDDQGDACDPLDDTDMDDDGVPNGPDSGDPLFEESRDAAIKWSRGDTHFVIRIDALGRLFQNEFTGLMTDAATLSPDAWAAKCQGMYTPGTDPDPGCATLDGGKEVPVTVVTIPRLLWTDPEVIDWINDRNDNPLFELGQHGTYHASNTTAGDWKDLGDRNFFSCELCGFNADESYELLKVGYDTLLGNYGNRSLSQSGATPGSPKIDWTSSANPLISYSPPFNASDTESRRGTAWLGFKAFSASEHEETTGSLGQFFSPEGSHHEQFDQFGMYHASADLELEPPAPGQSSAQYANYLQNQTDDGGLTTWLIEEVEWSGRPCNELDRLDDLCNGESNRENNTVYGPRWDGWMQLLEHVKDYPGGVAMTMGEVALAKGYDNALTVDNPGQADADHDGIGNVIEGVTVTGEAASLSRNVAGELSATVENGAGDPLAGQEVEFTFDADGDTIDEQYVGTTGADGVATVSVTATRPVGEAPFSVSWNGGHGVTASGVGTATVADATQLSLDAATPTSGQVTDSITVSATLLDSDGQPLASRSIEFSLGTADETATTDSNGVATTSLTIPGPAGAATLRAEFAGAGDYGGSSDSVAFTIARENTVITLAAPVTKKGKTTADVRLTEADGAGLGDKTIEMFAEVKKKNTLSFVSIGTVQTDGNGDATASIPAANKNSRLRAVFDGDSSFLGSSVTR